MDPFTTPPRHSTCNSNYILSVNRRPIASDDVRKRSERREEFLAKRRSGSFDSPGPVRKGSAGLAGHLQDILPTSTTNKASRFKDCLEKITSANCMEVLEAVQEIRLATCVEDSPPLDLLVRMGFIRSLIVLLSDETESAIRFEAAWALCNIAGGDSSNTKVVMADGALPPLVSLLDSTDPDLVYQAVWAIGNIVADNGYFRNLAFENGLLRRMLKYFTDTTSVELLRSLAWLVVNICRTKNPAPSVDLLHALLPRIVWMVNHHDRLVKTDAIWSLAYLSDGPPELSDLLVTEEYVLKSIEDIPVSDPDNIKFLMGAVRLVGNLLSGTDAQCDVVMRTNFVRQCPSLLDLKFLCVQKETLMCLANVAVGSSDEIQAILEVPGLLARIVKFLQNEHRGIVQETAWVIANIVQGANLHQIAVVLESGVIVPLCEHLSARDVDFVKIILETIGDLLRRCPSDFLEDLCRTIEQCGGLAKIENFQQHDNDSLYELSYAIFDTFFKGEDDELDLDLAKDAALFDFKMPFLLGISVNSPNRSSRSAQKDTTTTPGRRF